MLASKQYSLEKKYLKDKRRHMSNTKVNKDSPNYFKHEHDWLTDDLWNYIREEEDEDQETVDLINEEIKDIVIKTIIMGYDELLRHQETWSSHYNR